MKLTVSQAPCSDAGGAELGAVDSYNNLMELVH
jgi:hypothetical protein